MRGRATSVALPALIVLVLVAIVAVAATGSASRGSSATRAPSTTLLDALFTLSLLAVVAGAILLVYGLFQRKEIARQMASGRYPRFTLVGFLAFVVLVTAVVSLFKRPWDLSNANEDGVLGGRDVVPVTPGDAEPVGRYEPHLSWITIAALIGLVVAAGVAYVISGRRARPLAQCAQLVPNLSQCLDRALLHRGVDVVVRELSLCEELGQAGDRIGPELEVLEDAHEVLVRRLEGVASDPVRREHTLEARIGGDDRPPWVGFRAEIVECVVERPR